MPFHSEGFAGASHREAVYSVPFVLCIFCYPPAGTLHTQDACQVRVQHEVKQRD